MVHTWKLLPYQSHCKSYRGSGSIFLFSIIWSDIWFPLGAPVSYTLLWYFFFTVCDLYFFVHCLLSYITSLLSSFLYPLCSAVQFLSHPYLSLSLPFHHAISSMSCHRKSIVVPPSYLWLPSSWGKYLWRSLESKTLLSVLYSISCSLLGQRATQMYLLWLLFVFHYIMIMPFDYCHIFILL